MLYTTLDAIRSHGPCPSGWEKLLASLTPKQRANGKRRIGLDYIVKSNDLADALWALRAVPQTPKRDRLARLFAIKCAEWVLPEYEAKYPNDKRPREALRVARRFVMGRATKAELDAARSAAAFAAYDAAAFAAYAAADAAAAFAAYDAADAAAYAAAAYDAAFAAAYAAAADAAADARESMQKRQTRLFLKMLKGSK